MGFELLPHGVGEFIWGIDEDEVEAPLPGGLRAGRHPGHRLGADQLDPLGEAEALDVAERGPGVAVDEDGVLGTARERLDAERAGPAEEVEDAGAEDPFAERREDRLAHPVGRSAGPSSRAGRAAAAPSALRR